MSKQITNIVFTKNRPLQLEGYLESLYNHFTSELIQTYVIYKPELFDNEYQQVFQKYSSCIVVEETDFSNDFFSILNVTDSEYMLFGVDDVVYFDSVDFDLIDNIFRQKDDIFGFSLRFGQNILSGPDETEELKITGQNFHSLDWTQGQTPAARYPFELCATIYKTEMVKTIIKNSRNNNSLCENFFAPDSIAVRLLGKIIGRHNILKKFGYFYNPNTLESWNCRWSQNHAEQLPKRIYFQKLCAAAIQVNMVNTSTNNECDNCPEYTVEILAEKYRQGYRLDIDFIATNKPRTTHCGSGFLDLIRK